MDHFCGRKDVLGFIRKRVGDLKEGYRQNLALIGSRHIGKSSILHKFLNDLDDNNVIPVYLNLENRDLHYFVSKATRTFLYQYAKVRGLPLQETLPLLAETVRPTIPHTADAALEAAALVEKGKWAEAYEAVLRLPDVLIKESGLSCVFILDEFHQLEDFGVEEPFKALADSITMQKGCLFIITSSYEELAKKILAEKLTLLFGNFEIIAVQPFDLKASQNFIECRMGDVRIGLSLRNFLSDFTGGRPLYLDILLQELINLSAIYKQQEVYAPLVVQATENLVFSRWGSLSRYFELIVDRLCAGRANRMVMDILFALANGTHKVKDMIELTGAKQGQVTQKLTYLVDQDIVEKNGTYFYIKDKLLRYWVKYVFERRVKSVDMEPGRSHKEFKDEVTRAINEFQVTSRKDLSTRVIELVRCFENELLSLRGQLYKLPAFTDIKALKIKSRGGNYFDVLQAQTEEGLWLLVLRKDPVAECDINAVAEEARKMGIRSRRCVIVSLSDLDDAAKLRALEERMWIWNEPELNSLMNLYDKPYIVP
jgi:AAA+ ATPase superfamily predicted ATPase